MFNPCPETLAILNQGEDNLNHQHGPDRHDHEAKNEGPRQSLQQRTLQIRADRQKWTEIRMQSM